MQMTTFSLGPHTAFLLHKCGEVWFLFLTSLKHSRTAGSGIQPVNSEEGYSVCSTRVLAEERDALGTPLPCGTPPPSRACE